MPAIGATDPADLEAKAWAGLDFLRQLEQPRRVSPTPRIGGSCGYPVWYWEQQLKRFHTGEAIDVSSSSIILWDLCPEQFRQTGNGPWASIVGVDLLNLITYITTWPDSTIDETADFIYNEGGDLYSHQTISKRLEELDVTRKRAPTEGYQTQQLDVQFLDWGFLNCPPSLGVFQVPR